MAKEGANISCSVVIEFPEHEARFLAGLCAAVNPASLTSDQQRAMAGIAVKFCVAGRAAADAAIREHGWDVANAAAKRWLAEHPNIEDVKL